MFRRKEDGTEELIPDNDSAYTPSAPAPSAPSAPVAATAPSAPSAPVAATPSAPAAPAFRPVPPQAAMAAARPTAPAPMASAPVERPHTPAPRSAKRVLTVGPDIQMKGEITTCDRVVIEGMVDATMREVHTVELTETGSLKGTAEVEDAEISGSFEGDLVVRGKITIYASGRVRGNITYGEIEIQRGGQISGNIRNVAEAKAGAAAPGTPNKAKAA